MRRREPAPRATFELEGRPGRGHAGARSRARRAVGDRRLYRLLGLLEALKRHPFAVEAFFRRSLVLAYAVPRAVLGELIGPGLELDTYDDWGFLAIAMVQTERLRPRGLPAWLGRDFFLSGYRVFTRFPRLGQPPLRGLRILRSDTDRLLMARLGNLFTHYNYSRARVATRIDGERLELVIRTPARAADLHVTADLSRSPAPLPEGSPFRSPEDARKFAGPLPFTFSYDRARGQMVLIKGVRTTWEPRPVRVTVREATFLERPPFVEAGARLASAFYLENVPYVWKAGRLEELA